MTEADTRSGTKTSKGTTIYVNSEAIAKVDGYADVHNLNRPAAVNELIDRGLSVNGSEPTPELPRSPHQIALDNLQQLDAMLPMVRALLDLGHGDAELFAPTVAQLKALTAALETI